MSINQITFESTAVRFHDYPFPPSSIFPDKRVGREEIQEIGFQCAPPEIRTHDGEALFVSAERKQDLESFARRISVPIVERVDLWHCLLLPFLDTSVDDSAAREELNRHGISEARCAEIRNVVESAMRAYNFESGLWDWTHLGLYDVLCALLEGGPVSACHECALPNADFEAFYWEAMDIASRGKRTK